MSDRKIVLLMFGVTMIISGTALCICAHFANGDAGWLGAPGLGLMFFGIIFAGLESK